MGIECSRIASDIGWIPIALMLFGRVIRRATLKIIVSSKSDALTRSRSVDSEPNTHQAKMRTPVCFDSSANFRERVHEYTPDLARACRGEHQYTNFRMFECFGSADRSEFKRSIDIRNAITPRDPDDGSVHDFSMASG